MSETTEALYLNLTIVLGANEHNVSMQHLYVYNSKILREKNYYTLLLYKKDLNY